MPRARLVRLVALSTLVAASLVAHPPRIGEQTATAAVVHAAPNTPSWVDVPLTNASFDNGTAGWRLSGARRAHIVSKGYDDKAALSVKTQRKHAVTLTPASPLVTRATRGATYRVSVWFRSAGRGATAGVRLGGAVLDTSVAAARVGGSLKRRGWTQVTALAGTSSPDLPVNLGITIAPRRGSGRVLIDDVQVSAQLPDTDRPKPPPVTATWESGASGQWVANGQFATWRGTPVGIAGTWNDNFESQADQWSVQPQFEYGEWQGDLDIAVGAIFKDRGESWAAAAAGAYDARWRKALTSIAVARAGKPGDIYIRFAHEFNGTWFPWSVSGSEVDDFKSAWARFDGLLHEVLPQAKLVFCPSSESSGSLNLDWRAAFPGRQYVDVLGVDLYNQWPFVNSQRDFANAVMATDSAGAPKGLEQYRSFAAANGLPMALPEWSSNADFGDSSLFMTLLHQWIVQNAGTGPGQLLYEIQFGVGGFGDGQFQLFPDSKQPSASQTYQDLW